MFGGESNDLTIRQMMDCMLDYGTKYNIIKTTDEGIIFEIPESHPDLTEVLDYGTN